uniref:Putative secreted protein n=1 Tax=Anopheles marajoara TaxID=58244 RepID=A0A2M4C6N1_9DIPT
MRRCSPKWPQTPRTFPLVAAWRGLASSATSPSTWGDRAGPPTAIAVAASEAARAGQRFHHPEDICAIATGGPNSNRPNTSTTTTTHRRFRRSPDQVCSLAPKDQTKIYSSNSRKRRRSKISSSTIRCTTYSTFLFGA